ncbi:DUF6463 family protein [Streptomyces sp. NPDC127110]|uniref:DUF6463 family protein n=1 Tax=Streptomyces sp. NPDC127110 TaxID=3345362 RepID=UPI003635B40B
MSIGTERLVTPPVDPAGDRAGTRARTLALWAGRSTVAIGLLHLAFFVGPTWSRWADWLGGGLHGPSAIEDPANAESLKLFWAMPGSFAVPLVLLGLLVIRMTRTGQEVPGYLGWTLGAWVLVCGWILAPSGFPLGLVPVGLLLLARRANPTRRRAAAEAPRTP